MDNLHGTASKDSFDSLLLSMLRGEEGDAPFPYADTKGIPTISVGVNLRLDTNLQAVLELLGLTTFNPNQTPAWAQNNPALTAQDVVDITQTEYAYYKAFRTAASVSYTPTPFPPDNYPNNSAAQAFTQILQDRASGLMPDGKTPVPFPYYHNYVPTQIASFSLTADQDLYVFFTLAEGIYLNSAIAALGSASYSNELLALTSYEYDPYSGSVNQIQSDLIENVDQFEGATAYGNRPDVWYEIRFASINTSASKRRTGKRSATHRSLK